MIMRQVHQKHGLRRLALWSSLAAVLLGLPFPAFAQSQQQKIKTIAAYLSPSTDLADFHLKRLGFKPASSKLWSEYPTIRKLESAYAAAEHYKTGGGDMMLATLARRLSHSYESIKEEKALAPLFLPPFDDPGKVHFARGPPSGPLAPLPAETREKIRVIADYASRGPLGSTFRVFTTELGLGGDVAYDILNRSENHQDAYAQAFAKMDRRARGKKINDLAIKIHGQFEAIAFEPAFKDVHFPGQPPDGPSNNPPSHPNPNSPPISPNSGGSGGGTNNTEVT